MAASDPERRDEPHPASIPNEAEALPFTVEIAGSAGGERVLARAATASLARAIFSAACTEYRQGRVLLKRRTQIVLDSDNSR
ncbi:MAG: hypothetical protein ACM30I_01490 [Gemmatimonas sp.]